MSSRIYLDNAATSWPKPEAVYRAVDGYLRALGAPAGRGTYGEAAEVERLVADARRRVAGLVGAEDPQRIVFAANGTDALNLALHGSLRAGDHVVTTDAEHNSVLRPLRFLQEERGVQTTYVPCGRLGVVDPAAIEAAIQPGTRLIVLTHASNVTGALQPAEEIGCIARRHQILFLLDAAQSLGQVPVLVPRIGCSMLAAPAHKSLLGPLGLGVLYIAPAVDERLRPIRQGGTGTQSDEDRQPDELPEKYESGNLNVPAIVGLGAGLEWIEHQGLANLHAQEQHLLARLIAGLQAISGVTVHGPAGAAPQVGVVSITVAGYDPQEVAGLLDASYQIQVRSGLHCAPRMHRSLGTAPAGTVRFSLGPWNTQQQIDRALEAVSTLAAAAPPGAPRKECGT